MATESDPPLSGAEVEVSGGHPLRPRFRIPLGEVLTAGLHLFRPDASAGRGLDYRFVLYHRTGRDGLPLPGAGAQGTGLDYLEVIASHAGGEVWRDRYGTDELLRRVLLPVLHRIDPDETTWLLTVTRTRPDYPLRTIMLGPRPSLLTLNDLSASTAEQEPSPGLGMPDIPAPSAPLRRRRPRLSLDVRPREGEPGPAEGAVPADVLSPGHGAVCAIYSREAHELLVRNLQLSHTREDGGFLAGTVHTVRDGGHLVRIDEVHPAEHAIGSAVDFVFTGESLSTVSRLLDGSSRRLVGWYHTHLFSPDSMGLSLIDVHTHLSTFGRAWQLAALVNIGTGGRRTLRTYSAGGKGMTECTQWVADERGGHRPAGSSLVR